MRTIYNITVLALALVALVGADERDEKIQAFLQRTMEAYPSYLSSSIYYDPTPEHREPLTGSFNQSGSIDVEWVFTNYRVHNHSHLNSWTLTQNEVNMSGTANEILLVFQRMDAPGIWIDGNYTANGTIFRNDSNIPVRGQGNWRMTSSTDKISVLVLRYNYISIVNDRLDLRYAVKFTEFHLDSPKYELDGLDAGGEEQSLAWSMMASTFDRLGREMLPLSLQLHYYLISAFNRTPLSDM